MPMFKNLWLDRTKNQMHLWETDGSHKIFDYMCKSYEVVPNLPNAKMRTVYGIPVRSVYDTYMDERNKSNNGIHNCESDIQPEIRFIADYYSKVEDLKFKFNEYNVCYFDIEVEIDKGFPEPALAEKRVNLITAYGSKSNKFLTFGLEKDFIDHVYLSDEELASGIFPDGHEEIREVTPEGYFVNSVKYYIEKERKITFDSKAAHELGYENNHEYIRFRWFAIGNAD